MQASPAVRGALVLVMVAACTKTEGGADAGVDGPPPLDFQPFVSTTWSLTIANGAAQLSITDAGGPPACALATDHRNGLTAAGHQLIAHLPGAVGGPCPAGMYPIKTSGCPATLGPDAFVPESCAYYRRFDAQGVVLGLAVARSGEITIVGSANSCAVRANMGFLGGSFSEDYSLVTFTTDPWCN